MKNKLSTSFITPYLDIRLPNLYDYILDTYMGNADYQGDSDMDKYFYVVIKDDCPYKEVFFKCKHYHDNYYLDNDRLLLIYTYPDIVKYGVVKEFIEGKYSRISSWYVNQYYQPYVNGKPSINYRILKRDPELKKYWEEKTGITLEEGAEVWSKIKEEDEILNYNQLEPSMI